MVIPDAEFRRYRDAFLARDLERVHRTGDALAERLAGEPWSRHLTPAVILVHGSALVGLGAPPPVAIPYLVQGLAMLDQLIRDPGTGQDEQRDLERELGPLDPFRVVLMDQHRLAGGYPASMDLASQLEAPDHDVDTRLAALRADASLRAVTGDGEGAHQLLNAASSLAERSRTRLGATLVDLDRALVLGVQGRMPEAQTMLQHLLRRVAVPGVGTHGAWMSAAVAATCLTLSRYAAEAGDLAGAEQLLAPGVANAEALDQPHWHAQVDLTISTVLWAQGRTGPATELCRQARAVFEQRQERPAAAAALLHEGRIAWSANLAGVAAPLLTRARAELAELGHHREITQIDQALQQAPLPSDGSSGSAPLGYPSPP